MRGCQYPPVWPEFRICNCLVHQETSFVATWAAALPPSHPFSRSRRTLFRSNWWLNQAQIGQRLELNSVIVTWLCWPCMVMENSVVQYGIQQHLVPCTGRTRCVLLGHHRTIACADHSSVACGTKHKHCLLPAYGKVMARIRRRKRTWSYYLHHDSGGVEK